jgi:hypothetical protein
MAFKLNYELMDVASSLLLKYGDSFICSQVSKTFKLWQFFIYTITCIHPPHISIILHNRPKCIKMFIIFYQCSKC